MLFLKYSIEQFLAKSLSLHVWIKLYSRLRTKLKVKIQVRQNGNSVEGNLILIIKFPSTELLIFYFFNSKKCNFNNFREKLWFIFRNHWNLI